VEALPRAQKLLAQDGVALHPSGTLRWICWACTKQEQSDGAIAKTQVGSPPYRARSSSMDAFISA
jgi:hypothetical protein